MDRPQMIVVGGPNGVGKTTFANRAILEYGFPYISADKIAAELPPDHSASAAFEAGREFIRQTVQSIHLGTSFIVETTLSGRSFANTIRTARELGYEVRIQMIFVDSASTSESRVGNRVRRGGHDVPPADIRRRFPRALANFWTRYRELADFWVLTYNGDLFPRPVASCDEGHIIILDRALFAAFFELAEIDHDF